MTITDTNEIHTEIAQVQARAHSAACCMFGPSTGTPDFASAIFIAGYMQSFFLAKLSKQLESVIGNSYLGPSIQTYNHGK